MRLVTNYIAILVFLGCSNTVLAGVYKCTDDQGNTSYQAAPCAQEKEALEINIKTGGLTDLSLEKQRQQENVELKKQQEAEQQAKIAKEAKRVKDAAEQSALNQQLIKDNPIQYTAFAIPPYKPDSLSSLVKQYEARLPEIEKFRRIAAQKALATGECKRVEADELSVKSSRDKLVISIDCSTAKTFFFNEQELVK